MPSTLNKLCLDLLKIAHDLITCQQEDIEKLKIENQSLRSAANSYKIHYDEARTEAVKEFAKRLIELEDKAKGIFGLK